MPDPSTIARDGDRAVSVARAFQGPRALIWQAFTDPGVLTQWLLGPPGWEMHVCQVDARTGGSYTWRWRNGETGEEFGFSGQYAEVEPLHRMADTQTFEHGSAATPMGEPTTNTVVFEDIPGGTRVITHIRYPDAATMEMVLAQGMTDGMEMSYARLDKWLADRA